ncbi:hypothetical protein [Hyphomicrobium sp. LHD-15]|uniref:hypothetical protein n=1 Tax=Hyphomicrobium sp. LHD-15 TaxID=3072142 RepID=UPI00280C80B9|nr:hypothetical protein [Hyphomicrobium sp. LHD-15]MDQ8699314.1 hypothetical protein [Hyphomicrobium sp. LHD-15]
MTVTSEGFHPAQVQATIEEIRYWVPTIKDVAHVFEGNEEGSWLLSIEPVIGSACPVAIALKENGRFDISIAGETYDDRVLATLDQIVLMLERIADGHVIQRRWVSSATGAHHAVETIVTLGPGLDWRGGPEPHAHVVERHDRHFLPYRRV